MAKKKRSPRREGDQTPKASFEESLAALESVVRDLEDGGLGLQEALARYEEGVRHLRRCYRALRQAEQKIELLAGIDAEGEAVTEPLDEPPPRDDAATREESARSPSKKRPRQQRESANPLPEDDLDGPPTLF